MLAGTSPGGMASLARLQVAPLAITWRTRRRPRGDLRPPPLARCLRLNRLWRRSIGTAARRRETSRSVNVHAREFIGGLAALAPDLPLTALAQQAGQIPTIGVLWHAGSPSEEQPYFDALIQGFKKLGYVEGRNISFEHRFPNETPERFRQMAAELAALNVATP